MELSDFSVRIVSLQEFSQHWNAAYPLNPLTLQGTSPNFGLITSRNLFRMPLDLLEDFFCSKYADEIAIYDENIPIELKSRQYVRHVTAESERLFAKIVSGFNDPLQRVDLYFKTHDFFNPRGFRSRVSFGLMDGAGSPLVCQNLKTSIRDLVQYVKVENPQELQSNRGLKAILDPACLVSK